MCSCACYEGCISFSNGSLCLNDLSKLSTHLCELDCDRVSFMSSSQSISLDFAHVTGLTRTVHFSPCVLRNLLRRLDIFLLVTMGKTEVSSSCVYS